MRVVGVLALTVGAMVGLAYLVAPGLTGSLVPPDDRAAAAIAAALMLGACVAAIAVWAITEFRFWRLVKAAERIVEGDLAVSVSTRGNGLSGRLARAISGISKALAETHDRATIDRLTGVTSRQALGASLFAEVERA